MAGQNAPMLTVQFLGTSSIGVFPTVDSWVRLVTCYLVEYSEDWGLDRSYIKREKIQEAMERNQAFLMARAAN